MDIPDEAIQAAAQARLGPSPRLEDLLKGHLAYELNMAEEQLEAAAPHIARAAQVQILREIQGQIGEGDDVYDVGMVIHRKLAELEQESP